LEILEVCVANDIIVFADEIHSDLVYRSATHIPFATLSEEAKERTVSAIGVGKTFNMAGFAMSSIVVQDEKLKKQFKKAYDRVHFAEGNVLSHVAFEAAYCEGAEWLETLKVHLYENYKMLEQLTLAYPKLIKITPIEGTYLAWLDCHGLGLRDKALREFFVKEAKLGLNAGISFGREGSGFMRLNFAISKSKMKGVIEKLDKALRVKS
jgi:cystathionine beta-lyase